MKILVATHRTQGWRDNDFCFVPEGEPVGFGIACDGESVDGSCGCRRSMVGVNCGKGTTTMMVEEVSCERPDLFVIIANSFRKGDFAPKSSVVSKMVDTIINVALQNDVGTVLEYRDGWFRVRKQE